MKEFEKIEALLRTKAYHELTSAEQAIVDRELTEEAYEELHISITQLKDERLHVRKDVKHSLMREFKSQERNSVNLFFRYRLPAYTHTIPLLVILFMLFWPKEASVITQDRIVEVMIRDTIQVTQVDTLWLEKIVKVPTPIYVTQDLQPEEEQEVQPVINRSISEQKEVIDLVVRGE